MRFSRREPERIPNFYLEMEDATASKPILSCRGRFIIDVPHHSDSILVAEMTKPVKIVWARGNQSATTSQIAITAGHGRSIKSMKENPFFVAVLLPKIPLPSVAEDFEHISRGSVWLRLPMMYLEELGYA